MRADEIAIKTAKTGKVTAGRHWIGGKKVGKVVSVQRNIFWRENIGDDQTYIFSVVWSSLLDTEINF
jgi:hypothetical protein